MNARNDAANINSNFSSSSSSSSLSSALERVLEEEEEGENVRTLHQPLNHKSSAGGHNPFEGSFSEDHVFSQTSSLLSDGENHEVWKPGRRMSTRRDAGTLRESLEFRRRSLLQRVNSRTSFATQSTCSEPVTHVEKAKDAKKKKARSISQELLAKRLQQWKKIEEEALGYSTMEGGLTSPDTGNMDKCEVYPSLSPTPPSQRHLTTFHSLPQLLNGPRSPSPIGNSLEHPCAMEGGMGSHTGTCIKPSSSHHQLHLPSSDDEASCGGYDPLIQEITSGSPFVSATLHGIEIAPSSLFSRRRKRAAITFNCPESSQLSPLPTPPSAPLNNNGNDSTIRRDTPGIAEPNYFTFPDPSNLSPLIIAKNHSSESCCQYKGVLPPSPHPVHPRMETIAEEVSSIEDTNTDITTTTTTTTTTTNRSNEIDGVGKNVGKQKKGNCSQEMAKGQHILPSSGHIENHPTTFIQTHQPTHTNSADETTKDYTSSFRIGSVSLDGSSHERRAAAAGLPPSPVDDHSMSRCGGSQAGQDYSAKPTKPSVPELTTAALCPKNRKHNCLPTIHTQTRNPAHQQALSTQPVIIGGKWKGRRKRIELTLKNEVVEEEEEEEEERGISQCLEGQKASVDADKYALKVISLLILLTGSESAIAILSLSPQASDCNVTL